jgi:hypothetical protein
MMQSVRVLLDRVGLGPQAQWFIRVRAKDKQKHPSLKNRQIIAKFGVNGTPQAWSLTTRKTKQTVFSIPIRLFQTQQGWVLGPVIGILTSARGHTFGGNRLDYRDLSKVGKRRHTCVYVFTPETIQYEQHEVQGYVWTGRKNRAWIQVSMPIPDIVYNRVPNRARERDFSTQRAKQWLIRETSGKLFNSRFFDKIELMRYLSQTEETRLYLPQTEIYRSRDQLLAWLKSQNTVYVKPANGTIGNGIIRVDRSGNGWIVKRQQKGNQTLRQFEMLPYVANHIAQFITPGRYIIQKGIDLADWNGRMFDLRVLLQKNRKRRWTITGIGARVAGVNRITTHVPNGGMIANAKRVLADVFQGRAAAIYQEVKHLALQSAKQIEQNVPHLAEMSMDIGVDQSGKPWFIEANAKPMKFDEPFIRQRSLLRIIHMAEGVYENDSDESSS